jgi:hypothetical protein
MPPMVRRIRRRARPQDAFVRSESRRDSMFRIDSYLALRCSDRGDRQALLYSLAGASEARKAVVVRKVVRREGRARGHSNRYRSMFSRSLQCVICFNWFCGTYCDERGVVTRQQRWCFGEEGFGGKIRQRLQAPAGLLRRHG